MSMKVVGFDNEMEFVVFVEFGFGCADDDGDGFGFEVKLTSDITGPLLVTCYDSDAELVTSHCIFPV